ncbi:ribosome biogenesis GTPase YlqF [Candidatus Margulisiibacteriota bacterium]
MTIQWFPGHMAKAIRIIKEKRNQIDIILEVLDARIPLSGRNPVLDELFPDKPRLLLFNKVDLSNIIITNKWIDYFKARNIKAIAINAISGKEAYKIEKAVKNIAANAEKAIRCVVFGIPNVGKSSLINHLIGKKKVSVGAKPGVTKKDTWLAVGKNLMLLDTPGILWPKFKDMNIGCKLAITNCIKEERYDLCQIATYLCAILIKNYPHIIESKYKIPADIKNPDKIFEQICQNRGFFISGNELDYDRVYKVFLRDFRSGKLGRISLEKPEDYNTRNGENT